MTHRVLDETAHRPWEIPDAPWVMRMDWAELLFAHWRLPADVVRRFVPPGLELDTFDGSAWVGVVPFRMENVRPRGLPRLPPTDEFPELNVRTYVRVGPRSGVYFLSLDAASRAAVWGARRTFSLPYFHADMSCEIDDEGRIEYRSRREPSAMFSHRGARPATFRGRYGPTGPTFLAQQGSLEHFLTERYALFTGGRADLRDRTAGRPCDASRDYELRCAEIHHAPWPLQPAWAELDECDLLQAAGLPQPDEPPHLLFVRRIETVGWLPGPA